MFGEFAAGGKKLGLNLRFLKELEHPGTLPPGKRKDRVAGVDFRISLGFCHAVSRSSFRKQ
jgi:hypothetical protein